MISSSDLSLAQWVETNIRTDIFSLTVSGKNLFAGEGGGRFFYSTDSGTNWTGIYIDLKYANNNVRSLVVNGANLFAGTNNGVYLSTNNGINWNAVNNGLPKNAVYALAVKGSNIFAGTDGGGVCFSTNNGTNWTVINTGLTFLSVYALAVSGSNIFAGTYGAGVFLSIDNGTSWTEVNSGLTNTYVNAFAVSGANLFAGTNNGVFLSTNSGTSWTASLSGTWVFSLAFSGTNLFAGTQMDGIYLSTNNGTSWVNTGGVGHIALALATSDTNLFAGCYDGILRRSLSEMITTGVNDDQKQILTRFTLEQNYPNPFNPATTVSFNLPTKGFVLLKVYDLIGREVATIVSEEMSAGSYSKQWSAADLPSGVYFYRLQCGLYTEAKKLTLLR